MLVKLDPRVRHPARLGIDAGAAKPGEVALTAGVVAGELGVVTPGQGKVAVEAGVLDGAAGTWLVAVNVLAVPHAIEEYGRALDVVADAVVTDPHAPLTDRNAAELLAPRGVRGELLDGLEHTTVGLGVERLEVPPKLRREHGVVARLGSLVA